MNISFDYKVKKAYERYYNKYSLKYPYIPPLFDYLHYIGGFKQYKASRITCFYENRIKVVIFPTLNVYKMYKENKEVPYNDEFTGINTPLFVKYDGNISYRKVVI